MEKILKYKTKQYEIEAVEFRRDNWEEIQHFTYGKAKDMITERCINGKCYCYMDTPDGVMRVLEGDFIIRGLDWECYICKPDKFHKTYELVE